MNRSRVLTAVIAWAAGAATAVAIGLFALSTIDFGLAARPAGQPLGQATAPVSSSASPEPVPEITNAPPTGVERTITSSGGSVVARCTSAGAYLVSWSPAQGYRSDDVRRGPAPIARVGFEGHTRKYVVSVRCMSGVPQGSVTSGDE